MTLLLLFYLLFIITNTTQNAIINGNDTNVLNLVEVIQKISEDRDVIILTKSKSSINNTHDNNTDYEQSDNYDDYDDFKDFETFDIDEMNFPKEDNILRWLPKKRTRHSSRQAKIAAQMRKEKAERNSLRARALNGQRVAYVLSVIKNNFWTTLYLYGEVRRILHDRVVIDDIRALVQFLEQDGNEALKEKVLNCYRKSKETYVDRSWDKKSNNLVLQIGRDPLHDGVMA